MIRENVEIKIYQQTNTHMKWRDFRSESMSGLYCMNWYKSLNHPMCQFLNHQYIVSITGTNSNQVRSAVTDSDRTNESASLQHAIKHTKRERGWDTGGGIPRHAIYTHIRTYNLIFIHTYIYTYTHIYTQSSHSPKTHTCTHSHTWHQNIQMTHSNTHLITYKHKHTTKLH